MKFRNFHSMLLIAINFLFAATVHAQNPAGYAEMLNGLYRNTVPLMQAEQLRYEMKRDSSLLILDSREAVEFEVSHIPKAQNVGYDHFDIAPFLSYPRNVKVVIYCSVGYRSERIGEQFKKAGFTNIYNLYGGIFNWTNNQYPIHNTSDSIAHEVHGYNKNWSQWVNGERCNATY